MRKFMLCLAWLSVIFILGLTLSAQEAVRTSIPESVQNSLDGLQKTRTSNGVFNIQYKNTYFWALEKAVYVNLVFSTDLDGDVAELKNQLKKQYDEQVAVEMKKLEESNKKIRKEADKKKWEPPALTYPEAFHNLYMRVLKGSLVIQEYRSQVPVDGEAAMYYSFGTILAPGEYDVLVNINRFDNTRDGTQIFKLQVPELTLTEITKPRKDLQISTPVFFKEVKRLLQPETRFTVVKNKYENGPAQLDFYPCGNTFKASDKPTLAFFILGAVSVQSAEPWNIAANIEIRKGKERVTKFEELKLSNPYFYQLIEFSKKDKEVSSPLPVGDYTLAMELKDKNQSDQAKGIFEIAFKIVE
ncbi:MAG TPA: hypothetical protein VMZ49_09985 [Patescibacteria group bacterium]|nr:hypothetical protein [Patescibacteria group bacterium]